MVKNTSEGQPTDPNHKFDRYSIRVHSQCSCGWMSSPHCYGKGSKSGAMQEWREHRASCQEQS